MKTGYEFRTGKDYIHIVCDPDFEITKESVFTQWKQVIKVCKGSNIRKILIEACAPKRTISVIDAQQSASFFEKEGLSGLSMAMFFTDYVTDKLSEFFENVGFNRGIQIKFFNNRDKACEWLAIELKDEDKLLKKQH